MLSHVRKVLEAAITTKIANNLNVFARKYGLQLVLSPVVSLLDVDAVVKGCYNKIGTLDLSKAYYKINRKQLLKDCQTTLDKKKVDMLPSCVQPLTLRTKDDVLEKKAVIKLGLAKGAPCRQFCF